MPDSHPHLSATDNAQANHRPLIRYFIPLALLMTVHVFFELGALYTVPHMDSVMHVLGGVTLGFAMIGVLRLAQYKSWCDRPGRLVEFGFVVGLPPRGKRIGGNLRAAALGCGLAASGSAAHPTPSPK